MKRGVLEGFLFFFLISRAFAFGLTADQMYRNFLVLEEQTENPERATVNSFVKIEKKPVSENSSSGKHDSIKGKIPQLQDFDKKQDWNDIVDAVKNGRVTAFDLAEIQRLSEQDDVQALELLAWMYATGNGVRQDLQQAYMYYLCSARQGAPLAYENMRAVYQAMTPQQRSSLPFSSLEKQ